jgi:hypothetical protein
MQAERALPCADAPMRQRNGELSRIWRNVRCREARALDVLARAHSPLNPFLEHRRRTVLRHGSKFFRHQATEKRTFAGAFRRGQVKNSSMIRRGFLQHECDDAVTMASVERSFGDRHAR